MTLNQDGLKTVGYDNEALNAAMLDIKYGGQSGLLPNIGSLDENGKAFIELLNSQPYIKQNLIPFTMSLPRGYDYFPNAKEMKEAHIALFELHPESIDGIDATLTAEMESMKVGKSNQNLKAYKSVSRPECNVAYTIREKHGRPVTNFIDTMLEYLGRGEFDQPPLVTKLDTFPRTGVIPTPLELAGWSTLFVLPDYSQTRCEDAYLVIGQQVEGSVENAPKFSIEGVGEQITATINTGGVLVYGPAIRELGQIMLDRLETYNINSKDMISPIDPNALDAAIKDSRFGLDGAAERATR